MDNAQLYLSLVRPSMIPVVGESADDLFKAQIEVTGWKWDFHNADEQRLAEERLSKIKRHAEFLGKSKLGRRKLRTGIEDSKASKAIAVETKQLKETLGRSASKAEIDKAVEAATARIEAEQKKTIDRLKNANYADAREANAAMAELDRQYELDREDAKKQARESGEEPDPGENFKFAFSKRIDIATTQMLNSMKAGDKFPIAIFTMHQYSSNNPMSLVIKIGGLRLLNYKFVVDSSDTMTDLKEEWSCDFETFSYVYQNRRSVAKPSLGSVSDAKQIAAKAATQGTVRTFIMLPKKL
jgi:type VI protein secretion system component Hcp